MCVWFRRDDVIKVKQVGHKEEEEVEGKEEEEDFFWQILTTSDN